MRLQPLIIDLKKTKLEIPDVVLEPRNPQCINNFNHKQMSLLEGQMKKHKVMTDNFEAIYKQVNVLPKKKN